jgi:YVTN family beta-propeller protein
MRYIQLVVLAFAFVLPSAGQTGYVVNATSGTVSFVDGATDSILVGPILDVIVGLQPTYVVFSPDGTRAYVSNSWCCSALYGTVSVIRTDNLAASPTVNIPVGKVPWGLAITPDGRRLYVVNSSDSSVSVIDTSTNAVVTTIPNVIAGHEIAMSPDGTRAYVPSFSPIAGESVAVIDTTINSIVGNLVGLPSGEPIMGIAITPDGKRLYVGNTNLVDENGNYIGSNTVGVIDIASNTLLAVISVPPLPMDIAISPNGSKAYVAGGDPKGTYGVLSVIDTASNAVTATILTSNSFLNVPAVTPDGSKVFVTNSQYSYYGVDVFNTSNNTLEATITNTTLYPTQFSYPLGIAFIPPAKTVPFATFNAKLTIFSSSAPPGFSFNSAFTVGASNTPVFPLTNPVTLAVGSYTVTIPASSFKLLTNGSKKGSYVFSGIVKGVSLSEQLSPTGTNSYSFTASATSVLPASSNPVTSSLTIGNNSSRAAVTARFQ